MVESHFLKRHTSSLHKRVQAHAQIHMYIWHVCVLCVCIYIYIQTIVLALE